MSRHPAFGSEFGFELFVCRWAELSWPPEGESDGAVPVVVEADPAGLDARAAFGADELDSDLLHVVRHAPAAWTYYRDALPHPGYPWRYVREAIHRASARDAVEKRKRNGRIEIRRIAPYPDWVRRVVAIENKPDLDASAARALGDQLDHDVSRSLADEVWVATAATGDAVEPALLTDLPVEAGVLTVSVGGDVDARVEWHPSALAPDDGDEARRLELAERAYGRGWRDYAETMRPDCRHFELDHVGGAFVPHCAAKGRGQTAAECSGSCPDFEPEPPAWRTRGWPIEGGPGKGIRALLDRRRRRIRGLPPWPRE